MRPRFTRTGKTDKVISAGRGKPTNRFAGTIAEWVLRHKIFRVFYHAALREIRERCAK